MRPEVLLNWGRFALVLVAIVGSLLLIFAPWQPPQERPCTIREIRLGLDLCGGVTLTLEAQIPPDTSPEDRQKIMERSISVLETRVNALGVTEPIITQAGDTRIVVQLPGTTDPEQARQLVGSTALLEFRKVVKEGPPDSTFTEELDEEVLMGYECAKPELKAKCQAYVVKKEPLMTGSVLSKAEVRFNPQPGSGVTPIYIALTFNDAGAHQWREVILQLKPESDRIAAVLDRVVYSAPTIAKSLYDTARRQAKVDQSIITGNFTADEARLARGDLERRRAPHRIEDYSREHRGAVAGTRLYREGDYRKLDRWDRRLGFYGALLSSQRLGRGLYPTAQSLSSHRGVGGPESDAHPAGHRRVDLAHRRRGGLERLNIRAHA
jgi:preprotein translocase subunit SecD